jgi:hypothetical protein
MLAYWIKMLPSIGHSAIFNLLAVILRSLEFGFLADFSFTVMGESAGAGSIMHHLTARGGTTTPVFNKAILQSTAFVPQ